MKRNELMDQLRAMDVPSLRARAEEMRASLLMIRVEQSVAAQGKVLGTIRKLKRDIARVLTVMREKQLADQREKRLADLRENPPATAKTKSQTAASEG